MLGQQTMEITAVAIGKIHHWRDREAALPGYEGHWLQALCIVPIIIELPAVSGSLDFPQGSRLDSMIKSLIRLGVSKMPKPGKQESKILCS